MDTRSVQLQYSADENPPHWLSLGLAGQHVLFMLSGVLFIPILLAKTGRVSLEEAEYLAFVSILVSGVTSLIQVVRIGSVGSGYVLFMGTSGAFIACTLDAVDQGGLALMATLAMLSAPLECLISYFFRFLRKIFTPAVGGVVIMLVAVTIIPITLGLWVGEEGSPGASSRANLLIGLVLNSINTQNHMLELPPVLFQGTLEAKHGASDRNHIDRGGRGEASRLAPFGNDRV